MYHFFIEPFQVDVAEKTVRILGEDVNHIKNVLRMKIGEEFTATVEEFLPKGREERDSMELSGQGKSYRCRIAGWGEDEILCSLCWEENRETELPSQVYLFQGLPKGDKMETIIQKNVELGVYQILPVAMSRCVVKLDAKKAENKVNRWQAIAEAAAKQSGRGIIPKVAPVCSFREALSFAQKENMDLCLIPYELAKGMEQTRELMDKVKPGQKVAIIIGPEGGLEESEVEQAKAAGFHPITLGRRILRTETAGMTVMSWLMYRLEG